MVIGLSLLKNCFDGTAVSRAVFLWHLLLPGNDLKLKFFARFPQRFSKQNCFPDSQPFPAKKGKKIRSQVGTESINFLLDFEKGMGAAESRAHPGRNRGRNQYRCINTLQPMIQPIPLQSSLRFRRRSLRWPSLCKNSQRGRTILPLTQRNRSRTYPRF